MPWMRRLAAEGPTSSPPGANDPSCRPSAAHPRPVVLVHGFFATRAYFSTMAPFLADQGFCVFAATYGSPPGQPGLGGYQPIERSAADLATFVDRVRSWTGADRVDLVGHSEGTLVSHYYLDRLGGAAHVGTFVALAGVFSGTRFAHADELLAAVRRLPFGIGDRAVAALDAACASCRQMIAGSDFLRDLGTDAAPGVDVVTITSRLDELVIPSTSGRLRGSRVTNLVVQDGCEADRAEHGAVAWTPRSLGLVLRALDPTAPPAPCVPTVWGFGYVGPPTDGDLPGWSAGRT
jgi:triacylglycerol lipase